MRHMTFPLALAATAILLALPPSLAQAETGCLIDIEEVGCDVVEPHQITTVAMQPIEFQRAPMTPQLVQIGEILERGQYSILMNASYYGLDPVEDGWVYMAIGDDIFRVDWDSHEVLERVTDEAGRNW